MATRTKARAIPSGGKNGRRNLGNNDKVDNFSRSVPNHVATGQLTNGNTRNNSKNSNNSNRKPWAKYQQYPSSGALVSPTTPNTGLGSHGNRFQHVNTSKNVKFQHKYPQTPQMYGKSHNGIGAMKQLQSSKSDNMKSNNNNDLSLMLDEAWKNRKPYSKKGTIRENIKRKSRRSKRSDRNKEFKFLLNEQQFSDCYDPGILYDLNKELMEKNVGTARVEGLSLWVALPNGKRMLAEAIQIIEACLFFCPIVVFSGWDLQGAKTRQKKKRFLFFFRLFFFCLVFSCDPLFFLNRKKLVLLSGLMKKQKKKKDIV